MMKKLFNKKDILKFQKRERTAIVEIDLEHDMLQFFEEKAAEMAEMAEVDPATISAGDAVAYMLTQMYEQGMFKELEERIK
jgi:peptidase E